MIFSILCLSTFVRADTPQDLYRAGNQLYADGHFSDAAQKYEASAEGGLRNWVLEYNLANADYRAGQIGKAILHYERAFRMNSGQGDVIYNLNFAATKAGDPELPSTALSALAWRLFYLLSTNMLTLVVSALFVLVCAIGGWFLLPGIVVTPEKAGAQGQFDWVPAFAGMTAAAFILAGAWLGVRIYLLEKPQGVVVAPVAEVRSGPNTTYPTNFTVPEGRRVLILKEQEPIQGWLEIGVPQEGLKGWVPESSVEVI